MSDVSVEAVERRFDYDTRPAANSEDNATPAGLAYAFYSASRNTTYTTNRKYIKLTWDANAYQTFSHFIVYKSKVVNGVVDPNTIQRYRYTRNPVFYDTAVREGNTYYYQIQAVNTSGVAGDKTAVLTVSFVANDPVLEPPSSVSASANFTQNNINITWSS